MDDRERYLRDRDRYLLKSRRFNDLRRVHREFIDSLSVDELLFYVSEEVV